MAKGKSEHIHGGRAPLADPATHAEGRQGDTTVMGSRSVVCIMVSDELHGPRQGAHPPEDVQAPFHI
eukprot:7552512-Pyramimonas_sp.AAC.1